MSREQQPPSIETDRRALTKKLSVRLGLCAVGGFLGAVPLASTYSLSHTSVEDDFGPFPANISLAPGHSSLEVALGKKLYNQDLTNHGFGVNIQPDGLPDIDLNDLKDKDFHRLAEQTVGLYKEPRTVAEGYNQALSQELIDQLEKSELIVGGSLTAAGFLIISLLSRELKDDRRRKPTVIVMSGLAIVAAGASISIYHDWQANNQLPENTYAVSSLDDTGLAGTVTDSQPLNHLINHIKPFFEQEKQREEAANQAFMAKIYPSIDQLIESGRIALPDEDETMYLALSDLHGNYDMIESWRYFVQQLNQRSGRSVISFVTLNGDQTYGEVTAKQAVDLEGKLADGKPVLAIMGNHDSPLTRKQMEAAGITVLGGQPVTIAGLEVLGDDDPVITKLSALFNLGDNLPRDGSQPPAEADWQRRLEVAAGQKLAETADKTDPTTVMSHEGYELAPMFGMDIDQVSAKYYDQWFAAGGDDSGSSPDDVNNLPAAAYQIGHWHKGSVKTKRYRVLNNDNGTWSTVIELGSGGGALGSMNLTHFSTPWTPPAKLASGALITINNDSGLVTRLQFPYATPDGEFSTSASRHIGSPDGQPYPSGVVAEARPKAKVTKKDGRTTVSLRGMDASGHKDGQRN